jgi:hypothetical protein
LKEHSIDLEHSIKRALNLIRVSHNHRANHFRVTGREVLQICIPIVNVKYRVKDCFEVIREPVLRSVEYQSSIDLEHISYDVSSILHNDFVQVWSQRDFILINDLLIGRVKIEEDIADGLKEDVDGVSVSG